MWHLATQSGLVMESKKLLAEVGVIHSSYFARRRYFVSLKNIFLREGKHSLLMCYLYNALSSSTQHIPPLCSPPLLLLDDG